MRRSWLTAAEGQRPNAIARVYGDGVVVVEKRRRAVVPRKYETTKVENVLFNCGKRWCHDARNAVTRRVSIVMVWLLSKNVGGLSFLEYMLQQRFITVSDWFREMMVPKGAIHCGQTRLPVSMVMVWLLSKNDGGSPFFLEHNQP